MPDGNVVTDVPAGTTQTELLKRYNAKPANITEFDQVAVDMVKKFESFRKDAYLPTPNDVPTIGFGTTKGVKMGDKITKEEAQERLRADLRGANDSVTKLVTIPLNQSQRNALVSLVYNVGETQFKKSKALKALNSGDVDTFKQEAFSKDKGFTRQADKILNGLVKRRKAEERVFDGS